MSILKDLQIQVNDVGAPKKVAHGFSSKSVIIIQRM